MKAMLTVREVPTFTTEATEYVERQGLSVNELTAQLEALTADQKSFVPLDAAIYGLRVAPLAAPRGGKENLLAIIQSGPAGPIVVFVSILDKPVPNFDAPSLKKKLNIAVARLIAASRDEGKDLNAASRDEGKDLNIRSVG